MIRSLSLLVIVLIVLPCLAQEPVATDLDSVEGLAISAPVGFTRTEARAMSEDWKIGLIDTMARTEDTLAEQCQRLPELEIVEA